MENKQFDRYVIEFAEIVSQKVKHLQFIASDDQPDVSQSIIEWLIVHPEKADQFPPEELAIMNVRFRAIDWKRRNAREASESSRNPETGAFIPNKRMSQMTNPSELEAAMSNQCHDNLSDVEGKVLDDMNREHLEAKLKQHLTDLQWNVLYKRTIGEMRNEEISEEMKLAHYNTSRTFKSAVAKARDYLEIEMINEDQSPSSGQVVGCGEKLKSEPRIKLSEQDQLVGA